MNLAVFINPEAVVTLFAALCIALCAHFAHAMTLDQIQRVDKAYEIHETQPQEVQKTVDQFEAFLKNNSSDAELIAAEAQLLFYLAVIEGDRDVRIKKYQKAIDAADRALKVDPKNTRANFWKAASLGKQGLDIGISRAYHNARPMKDCLEIVRAQDEKYERGGVYRALGRLYYELPGWPLSFGNNDKALENLKKAVEVAPDHPGNHVYYAQVLIKMGKKDEARKELDAVSKTALSASHKKEMEEYLSLAKELQKKL